MRLALLPLAVALAACNYDTHVSSVDQAPEVLLLRPLDGDSFLPGEDVEVCASVSDDGPLDELELMLQSSDDGILAVSEDFGPCEGGDLGVVVTLSDTNHTLMLTAVDARGQAVADSVDLVVDVNTPPRCTIAMPTYGSEWWAEAPIPFEATATDAESSPEQLDATVASSVDGDLWSGAPDSSGDLAFTLTDLTPGEHDLVLTLTDPRGATDVCTQPILVNPCVDADADTWSTCDGDCDDDDPATHPDAEELADGVDNDCDGTFDEGTILYDDDGDGDAEIEGDCDDDDPAIHPGAAEVPDDGIDQDCSGFDTVTCQVDGDGDGYGAGPTLLAGDGDCYDPGEASATGDCDDADPTSHPDATDTPDDGVDQDCSGVDAATCHVDADRDGYGWALTVVAGDGTCDTADAESSLDTDCDDADPTVHPGATDDPDDGLDADCSGADTVTCWPDADGDAFGQATAASIPSPTGTCGAGLAPEHTDCDDARADVHPGAAETLDDGLDADCSGADTVTCYVDSDQDGYGGVAATPRLADDGTCDTAQRESLTHDDCNDLVPGVFPGATDAPDDGLDADCSGADTVTCYVDADHDGHGDASATLLATDGLCDDAGESDLDDDCDDTRADVHPGAADAPDDGVDADCSGADTVTCAADADLDSFGSATVTVVAPDGTCDTVDGEADDTLDCNDTSAAINPAVSDAPGNGVDEDCSGNDAILCYGDTDGDTWGADLVTAADGTCDAADAEASRGGDCDDTDASVHPGAVDVAGDGVDGDCVGGDAVECVPDADHDGHGTDSGARVTAGDGTCDTSDGEAPLSSADDCDDTRSDVYTGAPEVPDDAVDQDCSGDDTVTCVIDGDHDGHGNALGTTTLAADGSCDTSDGEAAATSTDDCNDALPTVYPGATEVPDDDVDQDCSSSDQITCHVDADHDGFGAAATTLADDGSCDTAHGEAGDDTDCDDTDASVHPGATETPDDTIDQDCSGADTITCQADADGDGFGTSATVLAPDGTCDLSQGESTVSTDCEDRPSGTGGVAGNRIYPGAPETYGNGVDEDCNGWDAVLCFVDGDGDGYGSDGGAVTVAPDGTCDTADGESSTSDDCADDPAGIGGVAGASIHPGAAETADNGVDEDCNGYDTLTCFVDADQDGYGNDEGVTSLAPDGVCETRASASDNELDCDDTDGAIHPGVTDLFGNGLDENCDGVDGVDLDGDGYVADWTGGDDCNDGDPTVHPGAGEVRDGLDDDCDGWCDEGLIAAGDLIVSELLIDPSAVSDTYGEWIELYNASSAPISTCRGWQLEDDGTDWFELLQEVTVDPGEYIVLARDLRLTANGGLHADLVYWNLILGNSGDEVVIVFEDPESSAFEVDRVAYTSGFDTSGRSQQLDPSAMDYVSNDTLSNWCDTPRTSGNVYGNGDYGTPGEANDCP